ncbi:MAG: glycoside hydrolase family 6 protein [Pseudomonadota bacterium]
MSSFKASVIKPRMVSAIARSAIALGFSLAVSTFSSNVFAGCSYTVVNQWGNGFQAGIKITNSTSSPINGWSVSWQYSGDNRVGSSWNVNFSGSNPYTASNVSWNGSIQPGQSVEFGFTGTKGSASAQVPTVTGNACSGNTSTPTTSRSASSIRSSASSIRSSSSVITPSSRPSSVASSSAAGGVLPISTSGNKLLFGGQVGSISGMSMFWSNTGWGGEKYYNAQAVSWLKTDWNAKLVRAAMGVNDAGGYLSDTANKTRSMAVIDAAIANNMYVIIDFHTHVAQDYKAQSIAFFQEMATKYGHTNNIIYEIYNEPLQVSWSNVIKPYAVDVIKAIRAIDPDNLIIVGTPTWSQDVDVAAADPIVGYPNIAYTLHFYAGTHGQSLRDKATTALNRGIPLFVTEWGSVNADGNGGVAQSETNAWVAFMKANNISNANWSLTDKAEGSAALVPGASANGGWASSQLTASGALAKSIVQGWPGLIGGTSSRSASSVPSSVQSSVRSSVRSSVVVSSSRISSSSVIIASSRPSSSIPASSRIAVSSRSATSAGARLDNPFVSDTPTKWYVNEDWASNARAFGGASIAGYNTAVWMDRIGAIDPTDPNVKGLREHLDAALDQGANLFLVVVYDLPNRDCFALASAGELRIKEDGFNRYKNEYITPLAAILADPKYSGIRIVAIIEPDSLPNLVTNISDPDCQEAAGAGGYVEATQFTLNTLYPIRNVYSYIDIAHSGWLGWPENLDKAITLIGNAIKGTTNGVNSIAGFVSNTANSTPLKEPFLDEFSAAGVPGNTGSQVRQAKYYEWNPHFSEFSFVNAWRAKMISSGFPSTIGMLVDTSRNGWGGAGRPTALSTSTNVDTFVDASRIDRRTHRGMWCNQPSGIGERPTAAPAPGIDAYVWVKPPGESDGVATAGIIDPNDPAKGFDRFCDPTYTVPANGKATGAMAGAPHAGRWFTEGFMVLLQNAYPAL